MTLVRLCQQQQDDKEYDGSTDLGAVVDADLDAILEIVVYLVQSRIESSAIGAYESKTLSIWVTDIHDHEFERSGGGRQRV